MNSSIALRLLWKEYRVQRGLWLSMAFGCFSLQALIAYLVPSEQESFQGILPVAFLLTGFYAIGSGAITFAIEREDGTQLRPVMLGCPPGLTLTIKTIFGVVTTAVLLAITLGSGMLMTLGSLTLPENTFQPDVQGLIIPLALLFVALPYLGCLLWSTFFSLLTRKVIVALGLAAVAMIGSYVVVAMTSIAIIESGQRQRPHELTVSQLFLAALVPCFLALLLLALNYLLTHRWLTRAFFDQTSSKSPSFFKRWRIRRSGLDGGMVVEIGVEDRTAFEVVSPEVAVYQPPPRFGLSLLYAVWGPNLWRHLRFLRWKEAIETRKIFVGFLLATLFFTAWVVGENLNSNGWHGVVGFFVHAACVACGAMAFRAEQDERKVQRLADMGLRPATVWFSKHLVWLVRAVLSVAAIILCVLFVELLYPGYSSRMKLSNFFGDIWLNRQLPNAMPNSDTGFRLFGRAIILTLTMYGVGQVCSQLIRSTIVSMFVAFVLALTVFGWAGVCYWFNVPFIISVMPLAIGCLLITWSRTNSWMKDDNRPRVWTWPVTSLAASLALIYFGTGLFRVYEVPWTEPFFGETASAPGNDGLTPDQRDTVLAPVTEKERSTFDLYQRAADLMGKNTFRKGDGSLTASDRWEELSEDDRLAAEKAIQLAIEAAESPECAEFSPGTTNVAHIVSLTSGQQMSDVCDLLCFDADRELNAGHPEVALDRIRSAFAVARHTAGRGEEMHWWLSNHMTIQVLRVMQKWAEHSGMDEKLVEQAVQMIDQHRRQMVPVEVTNYATAVMIRNTLDADMFTLTELLGDSQERLPLLLATKFPEELARSYRLLNAMERHDVDAIKSYRSQQAAAKAQESVGLATWFVGSAGRSAGEAEFMGVARSCVKTTHLLAMIASGHARDQFCRQDVQTECQIRATKVILKLQLQRRNTGKLPVTLDEFDGTLNDPWSDKPFIWYPDGLPGNLMQQHRVKVEAGTPFLITTGQRQFTIRRVETWDAPEGDGPFGAMQMGGVRFDGEDQRAENGLADAGTSVVSDNPGASERREAKAMDADSKQPARKLTRVEYVLDGWDLQPSRPDIVIWKLPRNPASTNGTPASAEAD